MDEAAAPAGSAPVRRGPDYASPPLPFDVSDYYPAEMGSGLCAAASSPSAG